MLFLFVAYLEKLVSSHIAGKSNSNNVFSFIGKLHMHLVGLEPTTSPSTIDKSNLKNDLTLHLEGFQHPSSELFFQSNNPCGFFGSSRVWDREILSPLLFTIVLDALSWTLDKVVNDGCISGFSVGDTVGILLRYLISTLPMISWYSALLILISFCMSGWFFSGFRSIRPEHKFGQVRIGACGSSS